jgi:hypothetical protein
LLAGIGLDKNYLEAVQYLNKSADQGNSAGQYLYGECLVPGIGTAKNHSKAVRYFTLAADQGNSAGQRAYAKCLLDRIGVAKDSAESARYFTLSADGNNPGPVTAEMLPISPQIEVPTIPSCRGSRVIRTHLAHDESTKADTILSCRYDKQWSWDHILSAAQAALDLVPDCPYALACFVGGQEAPIILDPSLPQPLISFLRQEITRLTVRNLGIPADAPPLSSLAIHTDHYERSAKIGLVQNGIVFRARPKRTGEVAALKELCDPDKVHYDRPVLIAAMFSHRKILSVIGCTAFSERPIIIFPSMEGGQCNRCSTTSASGQLLNGGRSR